jgi:Mannosyltransferase (PIG-V)
VNPEARSPSGDIDVTRGESRPLSGASGTLTAEEPSPSAGPASPARRVRRSFLFWPVVAYLAARVTTVAALLVADLADHRRLSGQLARWDGSWFLRAAEHGWPRHLPMAHGHVAANTIAFFPVFPIAIRWLSSGTTLSPLLVGLSLSAVTGLTAVVAVGLLVLRFAGREAATRATVLFALFPGTFAFSLVYNEGIVLTCIALGLMALLSRRWWLAGLLGLLATATSPIALAFVFSCAWSAGWAAWRGRTVRPLVAPVLAPLGFVAYMVWIWRHTGVLNAWRLTELGGWKGSTSLAYPFRVLGTFARDPVSPNLTGQILVVGTLVAIIGAVLAIRQRQPAPVLIYGLAAAFLAAISAPVGLRPRFVMLAFPLVVAYGTRLRGRAYAGVLLVSAALLVAMSALEFASWSVFP